MTPEERIAVATLLAKGKHKKFAGSLFEAVSILTEEVGEVAQAVNDGDPVRIVEELGDVGAVVVRMLEMMGQQP